MKKIEDINLINNIKNNIDADASLKTLVEKHSGIFLSMVHNYVPASSEIINKSDIINDKNYYIYKAALKFDENKLSKFSTFLGNETKWMCLNLYNKHKNKPSIPYAEDYLEHACPKEDLKESIDRDIFNKIIDFAKSHPDSRVETIFKMRYVEGFKNGLMPWKSISEELDMSIQGCINIHNSALKTFKNKLINEENSYVK